MDFKGLKDLKIALNQIQNDLLVLRQNFHEDNNVILNDINLMLTFIRQSEGYIEKCSLINEIQVAASEITTFPGIAETESVWKCYKEILQQLFQSTSASGGLSLQDFNKTHSNNDFDVTLFQPNLQNKIFYPQQIVSGNNWNQLCTQLGSESVVMMPSTNGTINPTENNKNNLRNIYTMVNKCNLVTNDMLSMYAGGDSVSLRRAKLPPQPEKDIEEIQQTISMQLKLQQHHSRHRYKFQPTHRAWPITPEINVVFQGNATSNPLFSTNSDSQIYTSNNMIGLHGQYQPESSSPHILSHPITTSNGAFYGYNNSYAGQLANGAMLQTNDCEYAQLPTSMFSFLNNSSSNRMGNCNLNTLNSTNNVINLNPEDVEGLEIQENIGSSKIGESKSTLIDYQIKTATLTWEDLANVSSTATN